MDLNPIKNRTIMYFLGTFFIKWMFSKNLSISSLPLKIEQDLTNFAHCGRVFGWESSCYWRQMDHLSPELKLSPSNSHWNVNSRIFQPFHWLALASRFNFFLLLIWWLPYILSMPASLCKFLQVYSSQCKSLQIFKIFHSCLSPISAC